jgi:hypothetical protein
MACQWLGGSFWPTAAETVASRYGLLGANLGVRLASVELRPQTRCRNGKSVSFYHVLVKL